MQAKLAETARDDTVDPYCASYRRTSISKVLNAADGGVGLVGRALVVGGWVRSGREQGGGAFAFVQINDGSCFDELQVSHTSAKL